MIRSTIREDLREIMSAAQETFSFVSAVITLETKTGRELSAEAARGLRGDMELNEKILKLMEGELLTYIQGMKKGSEKVIIETSHFVFTFHHEQDCCESVALEDFDCDFETNKSLLMVTDRPEVITAYEESSNKRSDDPDDWDESKTWTFYRINTTKGSIVMRWLGKSNGYYSEQVDIKVKTKE